MAAILPIILGFLWAAVVAILIFRAYRQFDAYRRVELTIQTSSGPLPALSVIVPARNEADVIGRCLAGLRSQDYAADRLRIIVVDDGSTDGTAAMARCVVTHHPRFSLIGAGELPRGWTGKANACWLGAAAAADAEWLCFMDADVMAAPPLLRCVVDEARRRRIDFLSLEPLQELSSVWERLVIPAGLFALAFLRDFRVANDPLSAEAVANGQFILVRRGAYEQVGGHAAVRGAICEDRRLAQEFKARGCAIGVLGAPRLLRTRMYRSLPTLWEGLTKNSTETLGGVLPALLAGGLAVPFGWASLIMPIALAARVAAAPTDVLPLTALALASLASLAMVSLHVAGARYFGIPRWYGLLFPVGYTLAALIACGGLYRHWRGSTDWKGRCYATRRRPRSDRAGSR